MRRRALLSFGRTLRRARRSRSSRTWATFSIGHAASCEARKRGTKQSRNRGSTKWSASSMPWAGSISISLLSRCSAIRSGCSGARSPMHSRTSDSWRCCAAWPAHRYAARTTTLRTSPRDGWAAIRRRRSGSSHRDSHDSTHLHRLVVGGPHLSERAPSALLGRSLLIDDDEVDRICVAWPLSLSAHVSDRRIVATSADGEGPIQSTVLFALHAARDPAHVSRRLVAADAAATGRNVSQRSSGARW